MTIEQRAEQVVKQWATEHPGYAPNIDTDTLVSPIAAAMREQIEECAKVAEEYEASCKPYSKLSELMRSRQDEGKAIATALRGLKG